VVLGGVSSYAVRHSATPVIVVPRTVHGEGSEGDAFAGSASVAPT